ncbi:MAG: cell wall-binding repeat-containing protein [Finegoldia sp.]|nr:cell wall-binding repeat-containing protein [Finegoldia sp.]
MKQIKKPIFIMSLAFTLSMGANTVAFADNENTEKIVNENKIEENPINNQKLDMDNLQINLSENTDKEATEAKVEVKAEKGVKVEIEEDQASDKEVLDDSVEASKEDAKASEKELEKAEEKKAESEKEKAYEDQAEETDKEEAKSEKVKEKAEVKGLSKASVKRVSADNRYQEAVDVYEAEFSNASYVVLTNSESFSDAISATNLSNGKAPILYTEKDSLNSTTAKALKNNKSVKRVYILGGEKAISNKTIKDLKDLGLEVVRLDGKDRYETNVKTSEASHPAKKGLKQNFVIASGESYADSLTASTLAYSKDAPVLLTQKDKLPTSIREYLNKFAKNNILGDITLVGGVNAISKSVEEELAGLGSKVKRVAGSDRYATSVAVAKEVKSNPSMIMMAGGKSCVDALIATPMAQKYKAPIILAKADDLSRSSEYKGKEDLSVEKYLSDNKDSIMAVKAFGGKSTVNDFALRGVKDLLSGKSLKAKPKVQALSRVNKTTAKQESQKKEQSKSQSKIDKIISLAKSQVGKAYVYGSAGPNAFDCSGLTSFLYKQVGVSLNRSSRDQASNGVAVSRSNLKPGDLMFFNTGGYGISHVGLYIGDNKLIHASTPSTGVIVSDINGNYYRDTFVTARRVLA